MRFDPLARAGVVELVAKGATLAHASTSTGVPIATIKGWITAGRKADAGDAHDFERAIADARQSHRAARRVAPVAPIAPVAPGPEVEADQIVPAMTTDEFRRHLEAGIRNQLGWAARLWSDRFLDPPPEPEPVKPESAIMRLARTAKPMPLKPDALGAIAVARELATGDPRHDADDDDPLLDDAP